MIYFGGKTLAIMAEKRVLGLGMKCVGTCAMCCNTLFDSTFFVDPPTNPARVGFDGVGAETS